MSDPQSLQRRQAALFVALLLASTLVAHAKAPDAVAPDAPVRSGMTQPMTQLAASPAAPRIDVVFALDTTGSMSGLIEGAKQKIWTIANELMSAQPTPEVRIGLVAYRDRGDAYVTRRLDLTDDIDAVWAELQALRAEGGGDGPESVNLALHEAVTKLDWSRDGSVYRVIFLVGDAPPHMDYPNEPRYPEIVARAKAADIVVNTVQCGSMQETAAVWRDIASAGGGEYAAVAQDGAMVAMESPVDAELVVLNRALMSTVVPYGDLAEREEVRGKLRRSLDAAAPVAASRLSYLAKGGGRANLGRRDLVDAVKEGLVEASSLPEETLPEPLRRLDEDERDGWVRAQAEKRERIQERIDTLVGERDRWLRGERERLASEGKDDAFDLEVMETLRSQAGAKGLTWE